MKPWQAILLTLLIIIVMLFLPNGLGYLVIIGTAIWAAVDSGKINLYKYKSGIAYKPVVLFIGVALLWFIGFPWYLIMKYKIENGLAELKDQYKNEGEAPKPFSG